MATVHVAGTVPSPPITVVVVAATAARARQLERLMSEPGFAVAGLARDPETAERMVADSRPSAVLVDLDLLDGGLDAIERIMASRPTPIVICGDAANQAKAALAAGVVDVVGTGGGEPPRPAGSGPGGSAADFGALLRSHLRTASRVPVITHPRGRLRTRQPDRAPEAAPPPRASTSERLPVQEPAASERAALLERPALRERLPLREQVASAERPSDLRRRRPIVVAIGASTGGPPALAAILRELPGDLGAALVVVQHMAEGFLEGLARWLDDSAELNVTVAKDGDRLVAGTVYLAPAGLNLVLRPGYRVELSPPPDGQYHVPGVDVTFASIARLCGPGAVGVLLTGMGRDGAKGLLAMREAGARTISQDEQSSVVWGMPAAALALDAVDLELALPDVAPAIVTAVVECEATQRAVGGGA